MAGIEARRQGDATGGGSQIQGINFWRSGEASTTLVMGVCQRLRRRPGDAERRQPRRAERNPRLEDIDPRRLQKSIPASLPRWPARQPCRDKLVQHRRFIRFTIAGIGPKYCR